MRLFIGGGVNWKHCWTCHFLSGWRPFIGGGRTLRLFVRPRSTTCGGCQSRAAVHELATLVYLWLRWYNGRRQSHVMEPDWFVGTTVCRRTGKRRQNIVRRQFSKKASRGSSGEGGGWLLTCGNSPCYHNNEVFSRASDCHTQINIWLKTQHGHTKNQTKSWKPHLCWAAVFVTLWPEPSSPILPHY